MRFCYYIAFFISCISVVAAFITDLPGIISKYKLLKNFALNVKILSCFITTFSKTFPKYKSKTIKQYDLDCKYIFFPGLGKM